MISGANQSACFLYIVTGLRNSTFYVIAMGYQKPNILGIDGCQSGSVAIILSGSDHQVLHYL